MDDSAKIAIGVGAAMGLVAVTWWIRGPSPNFTWDELTPTSTGIPNPLTAQAKLSLTRLAWAVLEPLRRVFGPIRVNSGYRDLAVNTAIGGSSTSSHMARAPGEAAVDIQPADPSAGDNYDLGRYLLEHIEDFPMLDQVIVYTDKSHAHVGIADQPRKQFLEHTAGNYTTWRG